MRRLGWTVLLLVGCRTDPAGDAAEGAADPVGGNILVLLVDDLGIDKVRAYGVHPEAPPTPTIDRLAAEGVLFRNAWMHPTCSPARAALLTGRYARRTGVGRWIRPENVGEVLDPDEVILPEVLALADPPLSNAAVGKWHLSGFLVDRPGDHPLEAGFSWHAGTLANPTNGTFSDFPSRGYTYYEYSVNGEIGIGTTYLTTRTTDEALDRLERLAEPWFLYVAYNAPHEPIHWPPDSLHPYERTEAPLDPYRTFDAMIVALDTEMGRLLDGIDPEVLARTTVVFLSDNGTPTEVIRAPLDPRRSKGTMYEGGVNVPLIVTGPLVERPGSESMALIESVDLLPTLAELEGVDLDGVIDPRTGAPVQIDGVSFLPHVVDPDLPSTRTRAYSSAFFPFYGPPYEWEQDALRDDRYKLVRGTTFGERFFEYRAPFDEGRDLLVRRVGMNPTQEAAHARLSAELDARLAAQRYEGSGSAEGRP